MSEGLLSEITILDLTEGAGGPFGTKLFADYGARVIKIERPGRGDQARRVGPFPNSSNLDAGALFLFLNTGKESVTLDIATATGRLLLLELVEHADVVIEGFAPGYLDGIRLSHDALLQRNPRLLITSVTPYGQTGPNAAHRATELTAYAAGGQMSLCGDADREPIMPAGHQASYQLGMHAFGATLAAFYAVGIQEFGQSVELSAQECMAATLELYLPDYAYVGREVLTKRRGNIISSTLGIFPCADGYVGVHIMARNFASFARVMGTEWMLEDEGYNSERGRLRNFDAVLAQVYAWAAECTRAEIYERSAEERCTLAPVLTISEVMRQPHLVERDFFRKLDDPRAGTLTYTGPSFRPSVGGWELRPAPRLGQHNIDVYGELLDISASDLVQLRRSGVI
jgi:crotonobetainyl-CoA:carnitine CoA-transferase CaiB-like acyl-CoA transferase